MEKYEDLFKPSFLKQREMTSFPEDYSLAMAYVPFQICEKTYDLEKAFEAGTLYPELNKPFCRGRSMR